MKFVIKVYDKEIDEWHTYIRSPSDFPEEKDAVVDALESHREGIGKVIKPFTSLSNALSYLSHSHGLEVQCEHNYLI